MHGHLIAVEVSIERGADQRVDLDSRALDQLDLERLNAKSVQRWRPVEEDDVVLDDLLQHLPDPLVNALDKPLGRLDVMSVAVCDQLAHDERLE